LKNYLARSCGRNSRPLEGSGRKRNAQKFSDLPEALFGVAVFLFIGELTARAQQLLNPINIASFAKTLPANALWRTSKESFVSRVIHRPTARTKWPITWPPKRNPWPDQRRHRTYPSDGKSYYWAFHTEPLWEAQKGELWLVKPEKELLADFKVFKSHLGRNSRTGSVTAELVDVGSGSQRKRLRGALGGRKVVLASGAASRVMRLAVWERKAAGVVFYRTEGAIDHPDLIGTVQLVPWIGPHGEDPTFAFSLSYRVGSRTESQTGVGRETSVHSEVEVETGPGEYPRFARNSGTDPRLPAILVYAHDNSRNTGGLTI